MESMAKPVGLFSSASVPSCASPPSEYPGYCVPAAGRRREDTDGSSTEERFHVDPRPPVRFFRLPASRWKNEKVHVVQYGVCIATSSNVKKCTERENAYVCMCVCERETEGEEVQYLFRDD